MEPRTKMLLFAGILIAIASIVFYLFNKNFQKEQDEKDLKKANAQKAAQEKLQSLKEQYYDAIKEGNKEKALELGRQYYSFLRGGRLTMFDEQAIANDLSVITPH